MQRLETSTAEFRRTAGLFATGVTVLTAATDRELRGTTANSLTTASLDPLLLVCCLNLGGTIHKLAREAGVFAACILAHDQEPLARHFANDSRPDGESQFATVPWRPGPATGAPLILGALGAFECRVERIVPTGDHLLFVAEVVALHRGEPADPLLFYGGAYSRPR